MIDTIAGLGAAGECESSGRCRGTRRIGMRRLHTIFSPRKVAPYLFVLPNLLIFGLFTIWPAINMVNISMYDSNNGRHFTWVGVENYHEILTGHEFWPVMLKTMIFTVSYVGLTVLGSTFGAVLLNGNFPGRGFFRAVAFLPSLLSAVVVGLLWGWIFDRTNGLANILIRGVGLKEVPWLTDNALTFGVVIFVGLWIHLGFYTLIMLSGLQGIEPTLYEAARVDGASSWQRFCSVTWPLLRPTTLVVMILSTISGFQSFDFIWTLTGGGPVGATTLIVQFIYEKAFQQPVRYGIASAGAVVLFLCVFTFTVINYLYGRRKDAA